MDATRFRRKRRRIERFERFERKRKQRIHASLQRDKRLLERASCRVGRGVLRRVRQAPVNRCGARQKRARIARVVAHRDHEVVVRTCHRIDMLRRAVLCAASVSTA